MRGRFIMLNVPELESKSDAEFKIPELEYEDPIPDEDPIPELEYEDPKSDAASEILALEYKEPPVEALSAALVSQTAVLSSSTLLERVYQSMFATVANPLKFTYGAAVNLGVPLTTEMSKTVYSLVCTYGNTNISLFSTSLETQGRIFTRTSDRTGYHVDVASAAWTFGGYVANQGSSCVAAQTAAVAYQHVVGDVELQDEYELSQKLIDTVRALPDDVKLLFDGLNHIVNAIPVDFMEQVVSPIMAECVRKTPLGMLFEQLSVGDKSTAILKAIFNVPAQAVSVRQYQTQGQYQVRITKAIDTLKVPGLRSLQDAKSVYHMYEAYQKLSQVIQKFEEHSAVFIKVKPALEKVRDAVSKGPAASEFKEWWSQPSETPQCIADAMFLCEQMVKVCSQKQAEMMPYINAGREGMLEVIDPNCLAKQLVCATVNIGIHQAKQQSGKAAQICTDTLINTCLNSAVYNSVVGPMSALVAGSAPAALLNGGASVGITPENAVNAMAVFDAPIKQTILVNIQVILTQLDAKVTGVVAEAWQEKEDEKEARKQFNNDLGKAGKCVALYSVGAFNGVALLGVAPAASTVGVGLAAAAVTLPHLLKHFTQATSDVCLRHTLDKERSKTMIGDIEGALSAIIKLCITPPPQIKPPIGVVERLIPGTLISAEPQLANAKNVGTQIGIQIKDQLPEALNAFGNNMGIKGKIASEIMYPQSATEKINGMVDFMCVHVRPHLMWAFCLRRDRYNNIDEVREKGFLNRLRGHRYCN